MTFSEWIKIPYLYEVSTVYHYVFEIADQNQEIIKIDNTTVQNTVLQLGKTTNTSHPVL